MKKFTKIISVMLAAILVGTAIPFATLAAEIGDVNADGKIAATDARLVLQVVAGLEKKENLKNPDGADVDGNGKISATDARKILQKVAGINSSDDSQKAQYATIFNAETAKAAKGTYNWTRKCDFSKDIDVGNATSTLNSIIKNIDENASLNSVVGSFLGVGDASGNQSDAGKFAMIAMALTEDDIKEVQVTTEQITLILNDSKNPSKGGNTPFNHVSNDFVTKADVVDATESAGLSSMMTVSDFNALYHDVKVTARIDNKGNPTELWISYKMYASMDFKVSNIVMKGNGEIETKIKYTNLNY